MMRVLPSSPKAPQLKKKALASPITVCVCCRGATWPKVSGWLGQVSPEHPHLGPAHREPACVVLQQRKQVQHEKRLRPRAGEPHPALE